MVRLLIALRATITGHQLRRASKVPLLLAGIVGLASAAGTVYLGFLHHGRTGSAGDILATVFALWWGGQIIQAALVGGANTLRPEIFALLPLVPRRLAWSLLLVGLTDPVLVLLLLAYGALVPVGLRSGPAATAVAVAATVLMIVLTSVLTTIAGGILGPGARRGRDIGTLVTALALSLLALGGTLLPAAIGALDSDGAPWLTAVVRALPSGWGANAVDAARVGNSWVATGWIAALAGLTVLAALRWPHILNQRMSSAPRGDHASRSPNRRRVLPATATGAVCAKELRGWMRDPLRLTCLLIAAVVGLGVAVIPRVTAHTGLLMPFAGPLTVIIAGACAGNLYGNDGTSLWLTILTPGSARPDVRGRQLAWTLIVGPFTTLETVLLTTFSNEPQLWPWAIPLLIALLGGAAGLFPLASLIAVQPLDEAGNPTPGWSVKIQICLYATTATALPTAAVLIAAAETGHTWLAWSAIPIATLTAGLLATRGSKRAIHRLAAEQNDILRLLVTAS